MQRTGRVQHARTLATAEDVAVEPMRSVYTALRKNNAELYAAFGQLLRVTEPPRGQIRRRYVSNRATRYTEK
jgi:hypothetical protein